MSKYIVFLNWLCNRLIYKHGYSTDDPIINQLINLTKCIGQEKYLQDDQLDNIIRKYYADFDMEYVEDMKLGFTDKERANLRSSIRSIVKEVNNLTNH